MTIWKLLKRSIIHYRSTHLWVVVGVMVSTAIIVGAITIGDSVRYSLKRIVAERLGNTEVVLTSRDNLMRSTVAPQLSAILKTPVAPVLQTRGLAVIQGGKVRLGKIQVYGVDGRFDQLAGNSPFYSGIGDNETIINKHLADRLGIKVGDTLLIRFQKLGSMPQDAPMAIAPRSMEARQYRIKAIASVVQLGRFGLQSNQVIPYNVFVSLSSLSKSMGLPDSTNLLLVAGKQGRPWDISRVNEAFSRVWTLADAGIRLQHYPEKGWVEIKSRRIFIRPAVAESASQWQNGIQESFTYFVNRLRHEEHETPYSFVSGLGPGQLPADMKDHEILINTWLGNDLHARAGDRIQLHYFILTGGRELREASTTFRVKAVVPIQGRYADKKLMPEFPGLAGKKNCQDWHPGIPIDLDNIRKKDEDYWRQHQGTPKAFITLAAARQMWQNRFGDLTAIRLIGSSPNQVEAFLKKNIDPAQLGFFSQAIKQEGISASSQSVDFSQLFLGLSFFIIMAGLLLTALLFVFNVQQRAAENGLFLALGYSRKQVTRLVMMEGLILIIIGVLVGGFAGIFYNQLIMWALKTVWIGIVGTSALCLYVTYPSILLGQLSAALLSFITIWLASRRQLKQPIAPLQRGVGHLDIIGTSRPRKWLRAILLMVFIGVMVVAIRNYQTGRDTFMIFLIAGFILLSYGTLLARYFLLRFNKKGTAKPINFFSLSSRNSARNPVRSLTIVGLLSIGLFLIFTIGTNYRSAEKDARKRESGTGGFTLYAESTLPVFFNLNTPRGREFYGLENLAGRSISFVQFRIKDGDDASCLNLNRVSHPALAGVDPEELSRRGAFRVKERTEGVDSANPWASLKRKLEGGIIPAIADQTVIQWGLGKKTGDTLTYRDERGEPFRIKLVAGLANSIFQGKIIVAEHLLMEKFPSIEGYRLFLVDTPENEIDRVQQELTWTLQDLGMDLMPASQRLAQFNKVENTYLSIFLVLGSLAMILGSFGIGVVIFRNVNERRGELALLQAVGFMRRSLRSMILWETIILVMIGTITGIASSLLSMLPSLLKPGIRIPMEIIGLLLLLVIGSILLWTQLAASLAMKRDLIPALRRE